MVGSFVVTVQHLHLRVRQILAEPGGDGDLDPLALVRAAQEIRDHADVLLAETVQHARGAGRTWQEIGDILGVSRQAAFQRYGKPIHPRTGEAMSTTPLPGAADLARTIIDDLTRSRWAEVRAHFDGTMLAGLSEQELDQTWAQLAGMVGAYEGHGDTDVARAGAFTVTNTPLRFEAGEFVARITFRDDRTVAGLYLLNPDAGGVTTR